MSFFLRISFLLNLHNKKNVIQYTRMYPCLNRYIKTGKKRIKNEEATATNQKKKKGEKIK